MVNIQKFIYELDYEKGNAWHASGTLKDGYNNKLIIVTKNGYSENSCEDIIKAVNKKYPKLKGYVSENRRSIWFYDGTPVFKISKGVIDDDKNQISFC